MARPERRGKSWRARVFLGRDEHGKAHVESVTRPTREALLDAIAERRLTGPAPVPAGRLTTGAYLRAWVESRRRLRKKSHKEYRRIVERRLAPETPGPDAPTLGPIPLKQLSPAHVDRYLSRRAQEGASAHTQAKELAVLHKALNDAVRPGRLIRSNPASEVEKPRPEERRRKVWDAEQVRLFLGALRQHDREHPNGAPAYPWFLFRFLTGVRDGEIRGLGREYLNLAEGYAEIAQQLQTVDGETFLAEPKSRASRRVVALPPELVAELFRLRERQDQWARQPGYENAFGLVFTTPLGRPVNTGNLYARVYHPIRLKLGLPNERPHTTCRAGFASHADRHGAPRKAIQTALGHQDGRVTEGYVHRLGGEEQLAAEAVRRGILGRLVVIPGGAASAAEGRSRRSGRRKPL